MQGQSCCCNGFGLLVFIQYYFLLWQAMLLHDDKKGLKDWMQTDCYLSTKGGKMPLSSRNCWSGEGDLCTREHPCHPCDPFHMNYFIKTEIKPLNDKFAKSYYHSMCRPCEEIGSGRAHLNYCADFVEGVGPYCTFVELRAYKSHSEFKTFVRPCEICCSKPMEQRGKPYWNDIWEYTKPNVGEVQFEPSVDLSYLPIEASMSSKSRGAFIYYQLHKVGEDDDGKPPSVFDENGIWYQGRPLIIKEKGRWHIKAVAYVVVSGEVYSSTASEKKYTIAACSEESFGFLVSSNYISRNSQADKGDSAHTQYQLYGTSSVLKMSGELLDRRLTSTGIGTYATALVQPKQDVTIKAACDPLSWDAYDNQACGECAAIVKNYFRNCNKLCEHEGLQCIDGGDDLVDDTCGMNATKMSCFYKFQGTSDVICECKPYTEAEVAEAEEAARFKDGESSQYIAILYADPVYMRKIQLSPMSIDRWSEDYVNRKRLQYYVDSCVDEEGKMIREGWIDYEEITGVKMVDDALDVADLPAILIDLPFATSCWRVYSEFGFVGLGSFIPTAFCSDINRHNQTEEEEEEGTTASTTSSQTASQTTEAPNSSQTTPEDRI